VAGRLQWVHVSTTPTLTHFGVHLKRRWEATAAIGIPPRFQGVSLHDGWTTNLTYTQSRLVLCNVHHLRELMFVDKYMQQLRAGTLKALLHTIQAAVATGSANGPTCLPPLHRRDLQTREKTSQLSGLASNPLYLNSRVG
jgi:transposase